VSAAELCKSIPNLVSVKPLSLQSKTLDCGVESPLHEATVLGDRMSISMTRPKTKILVDGGDPQETVRARAGNVYVGSKCLHQVSLHGRRLPSGTDVGEARY